MNDPSPHESPPVAPGNLPTRDPALRPAPPVLQSDNAAAGNSPQGTFPFPAGLPELSLGGDSNSFSAAPEPPKLDGYEVICAVGQGGMGTVWRAVQLSTRRNVALKLISAAGFASERVRQRFDREVEITARLEHPNIARVYDSGINRGIYFYAMELIDGLPLDQYVARNKLAPADILRLFIHVCRGVDHAHRKGVIHRDLKPGNILVSADGQPHVLDFGLAKALLQAGKEAGISIDGEVAGTPGYMAPEQAAGKLDIDARCDVYSLGVILYRLLTNQSPHDLSGTYLDILRRVSEEDPKRPRLVDRTMNKELETLILQAIQREPARRYPSAGALAQDIENYLAGDPISARAPTTVYYLRKRVHKHRAKLLALSMVLFLASMAGLLTQRLLKSRHDTQEQVRQKEEKTLLAASEARKKDLAKAREAVARGDAYLGKGEYGGARQEYRAAVAFFETAKSSPLRATLGLWDVERTAPAPVRTFPAPPAVGPAGLQGAASITSGAPVYFADGHRLIAGYNDGVLRVWDLASGASPVVIPVAKTPVRAVAVSMDGRLALTGGEDGALNLWNLETRALQRQFQNAAHPLTGWVTRVALSPDGRYALSASGASQASLGSTNFNDTLTLWSLNSGAPLLRSDPSAGIFDARATLVNVAFSPDSSHILGAGGDVAVWETSSGKRFATIDASVTSAAFSRDGQWVIAGASDGKLHIMDLSTVSTSTFKGVGVAAFAVWFDPQQRQAIAAGENGSFRAVDSNGSGWTLPPRGDINYAAISPDGATAITAMDDGICQWRMASTAAIVELAGDGPFVNAALSADGRLAVARARHDAAGPRSAAQAGIWDLSNGRRLTPPGFPTGYCNGIALSADGRTAAHVAGTVLSLWSMNPPKALRQIAIKPTRASQAPVALSPDGTAVAVAASDNTLWVYNTAGGEPLKLAGDTATITSVAFSPDGNMVLSGSEDKTARLWNARTGGLITVLAGHAAAVNAVAFSADGSTALTASGELAGPGSDDSHTIHLWEIPTGKPSLVLSTHSPIRCIAISGDGTLIAAGGDDRNVMLWDRATGDLLRTLANPQGAVNALALDRAGQNLLCASEKLSLWKLNWPMEGNSGQAAGK